MIHSGIRNIIFDFGGVILNISHKELEDGFRALGVNDFERLFNQAQQSDLFKKFEIGALSVAEFRKAVKDLTGLNVSDSVLDSVWNQIICDFPPERIDLIKKLKENYKLYLLSNTNQIHYQYYTKKFLNEFGFELDSLFHNTFWSFIMGKRKPDAEAYNEIIRMENIVVNESLFIDDSEQNIIAAAKLGFKTFHLKSNLDLTNLFDGPRLVSGLVF
jgi:glucose-1-phosphatase